MLKNGSESGEQGSVGSVQITGRRARATDITQDQHEFRLGSPRAHRADGTRRDASVIYLWIRYNQPTGKGDSPLPIRYLNASTVLNLELESAYSITLPAHPG